MKHFALKRRLNHINCLVLCWLFKKYFTLNSKKLFWSGRTKWFVLTHLHHISAEHKVWTLLKNSKKARGLHQLGVSKSKAIDFSLRENNVSVKFLRIHRARHGLLYIWTELLSNSFCDLPTWGRNLGPKLHPGGGFFGPWFFIILKDSHQDLSNEGSNLILSSLEVGHCVAQT